jgi:hypothetical protein
VSDTPRLAALRDKIQLLAAIDPDLQVFGASHHHHQVGTPLDDDGLAGLEARFGVLPDDYRVLVRAFGVRSAGPYYGLVEPVAPEDPQHPQKPDPARTFRCDAATPYDAKLPEGASPLDGTIVLAQQGCGGRSVLVVRGPRAGEVWSDWTPEQGTIAPEAKTVFAWYEQWIDRALLDWIERSAPRIAIDGAASSYELEAVALAFELVERAAVTQPQYLRTLGYLHLREERWPDADAKFAAAAKVPDAEEREPRLALDRGRLALKRGRADDAIASVRLGLASPNIWYSTRDELRDTLERAFLLAGRTEEALAVLDQRAQERSFSLDLHHRLARERLARNDVGKAGAVLERASRMDGILGAPKPIEVRVPASFDPIIEELRAAGRSVDAEALAARATLILDAN